MCVLIIERSTHNLMHRTMLADIAQETCRWLIFISLLLDASGQANYSMGQINGKGFD